MYQTAVSKQVDEAKDVATPVQSSVFNFSIMTAEGERHEEVHQRPDLPTAR
jgi:hypothetical protein